VLEILGGLLWGTSLFGGSFAGMALGGVVGNETHRLYGKLRDRTASPENHDLQKALLEALLKGIAATTDANVKKIPPSEQKQVRAWLKQRMDDLNWGIRNPDKTKLAWGSNSSWSKLLSATPEQLSGLSQKEKSRELRRLKAEVEKDLSLNLLPDEFRESFEQEWLPYVNLYLAEAIKSNPRVAKILQVELMLDVQTAVQQLTELFSNPQNFLSSVQVIDFDIEAIRAEVRDLAGQIQGWLDHLEDHIDAQFDRTNTNIDQTKAEVVETKAMVLELLALSKQQQPQNEKFLPIPPVLVAPQTWQCIYTLTGHSNSVESIDFSPDGQTLASFSHDSNDGTIKLWQLSTGKEICTFSGYLPEISPDGQILASSSGKTIKLWQLSTGREVCTLTGHSDEVESIAFSPDGQTLASGSYDNTIKLWQLSTGREICSLTGHSNYIDSIAFSPDGQILASGSNDDTIKLWQLSTGKEICTLTGHPSEVESVAFSADGQMLVSSSDGIIKLWQLSTAKEIYTLSGYFNSISPDWQILVSSSEDNAIKLWQLSTGKEICTLTGHSDFIWSVVFSPDGQTLASSSSDKTIKIWRWV
jgi:WD40 repeat protein